MPGPKPDRADQVWVLAFGGWLLALSAAAVVFIVWLWRARGNAEFFCYGRHRRGRGWVIGGWFCAVVNFWFPKQIVDDVIAASDPRTPPLLPDLRRIPSHGLVLAWWLTWVATEVIGGATAVSGSIYSGEPGYDFLPAVRRMAERVRQATC